MIQRKSARWPAL